MCVCACVRACVCVCVRARDVRIYIFILFYLIEGKIRSWKSAAQLTGHLTFLDKLTTHSMFTLSCAFTPPALPPPPSITRPFPPYSPYSLCPPPSPFNFHLPRIIQITDHYNNNIYGAPSGKSTQRLQRHKNTLISSHTHTHTHTHTHSRAHTHTLARAHTHTHSRTHTYHTHTFFCYHYL